MFTGLGLSNHWINLSHDGNVIQLAPGQETSEIWINANGTAGLIETCLEYANECGVYLSYTTFVNGISDSSHSAVGHDYVIC